MRVRNEVNFAMVPEWVLDADISAQAVRLYGILHRRAGQSGRAHASRRWLAEKLRIKNVKNPKTVDRAIDDLLRIGALEVEARYQRRGERPNPKGQMANWYVVRSTPRQTVEQVSIPLVTDVQGGHEPALEEHEDAPPLVTDVQGPLVTDVQPKTLESPEVLRTSSKPPPSGGIERALSRSEVRKVPCPECGADAEEKCWGRDKSYRRESNHQERVEAAGGGPARLSVAMTAEQRAHLEAQIRDCPECADKSWTCSRCDAIERKLRDLVA